jgi:ankyrin repeat protein
MTFAAMTFEEAHYCIKRGDIASLTRSLQSGLDPNLSNKFSWTLLMLAAIAGNTGIGRVLVSCGANVDATNDFGESALSLAAHKGHVMFVNWLVNIGANRHCRPHGRNLDDWLREVSGLPPQTISAVLGLLRDQQMFH